MEPAILLHIGVTLLVAPDGAPEMVLTKDEENADQYKEVVHLVVKPEEIVVMFDAVTFEKFCDLRNTKQIHCQPVTTASVLGIGFGTFYPSNEMRRTVF